MVHLRAPHGARRPRSALHDLTPADDLRGPAHVATRLAARATTYRTAALARRAYWLEHRPTASTTPLMRHPESLISA